MGNQPVLVKIEEAFIHGYHSRGAACHDGVVLICGVFASRIKLLIAGFVIMISVATTRPDCPRAAEAAAIRRPEASWKAEF